MYRLLYVIVADERDGNITVQNNISIGVFGNVSIDFAHKHCVAYTFIVTLNEFDVILAVDPQNSFVIQVDDSALQTANGQLLIDFSVQYSSAGKRPGILALYTKGGVSNGDQFSGFHVNGLFSVTKLMKDDIIIGPNLIKYSSDNYCAIVQSAIATV